MFAGNNPVNYADPSGLSLQGHPLTGGSNFSRLPASTTFGGFVDAGRGAQILGHPAIAAASTPARRPTTVEQFNRKLSADSNLSQLTRTVDPLKALVQQQRAVNDYRADQAASALRGANANELADIAERNAVRREIRNYEHGVGQVFLGYGDAVTGTAEGLYNVARHPINTITGVATAIAHPIRTGQAIVADFSEKSGTLRGQGAIVGDWLTGFATGGAAKAVKEAGVISKVAGNVGRLRVESFGVASMPIPKSVYLAPKAISELDVRPYRDYANSPVITWKVTKYFKMRCCSETAGDQGEVPTHRWRLEHVPGCMVLLQTRSALRACLLTNISTAYRV
jgi:hypothetical protein